MREFNRVLVANRGEIALRVIRALKSLEIESVAIYSDADSSALHVLQADRAFNLPGVFPKDTYLNAEKIVEVASKADCDAIHPGYGFLSENSEFAKLCRKSSIRFIRPSPETLEISGNKFAAKKLMESKGIPVVPYSKGIIDDVEQAIKVSQELGFPVLLKSAFGGGGRGIKEARSKEEVRDAFESSRREAKAAFGRFSVYIEKKLVKPRHIEIQILAGEDGNEVIHLGERECSIQRRYQKLVELSPSPVIDEKAREIVSGYALSVAKAVKYANAGTIEFLRDSKGKFYFLEINSRLQVEHPITELVTGVDLVESQIQIASRGKLPFSQRDVHFSGSAIECRINAEDPLSDFLPDSGKIEFLRVPSGPGIRVDTALYEGLEVPPYYDSLLAKLVAWGRSFDEARRRALVALSEFKIIGVRTTMTFHRQLLTERAFVSANLNTSFIEDSGVISKLRTSTSSSGDKFMVAAFLLSKNQFETIQSVKGQSVRKFQDNNKKEADSLTEYEITIGNKLEEVEIDKDSSSAKEAYSLRAGLRATRIVVEKREPARIILSIDERIYSVRQLKRGPGQVDFLLNGELVPARLKDKFSSEVKSDVASITEYVTSNFPAKVVKMERSGTIVKEGHVLIVLEAMKMEAQVKAPKNCQVVETFVREGEMVSRGGKLARLKFI